MNEYSELITQSIKASIATKEKILNDESIQVSLEHIVNGIKNAYENNKKILIAGNGGSAADAQHFAAEITCQYKEVRKGRPALALHTDTSALTAWGNDKGFDTFFARQIEAHGQEGDVLILISTSGNSTNLVLGAEAARKIGIKVFGLLGRDGGRLGSMQVCERAVIIPSQETPRIQESHILCIHIICEALDKFFLAQDQESLSDAEK